MGRNPIREVKTITDLSRSFVPHVHGEWSAVQVWRGATRAQVPGGPVPVAGPCVVLIPAGVAHACNPVPGSGWSYTLAQLDPDACGALRRALAGAPIRILAPDPRLRALFAALRGRGPEAVPGACLVAALEAALAGAPEPSVPLRPAPAPALDRLQRLLREQVDRPFSLETMGRVAGLSRWQLVRAFRAAFGLTPHAFHLNLRVEAAKARLRAGQEPAAVAADLGFCDQSHLTRVFAPCVGLTPAAYRRAATPATAIPSKTAAPGPA